MDRAKYLKRKEGKGPYLAAEQYLLITNYLCPEMHSSV